MLTFTVVAEIYKDNKIQYLHTEMTGSFLPVQDDMDTREDIVAVLNEQFDQYNILDLVGIIYKGETVWED